MKDIYNLLRIKHYIKNALIFVPVFFSENLFNIMFLKRTLIGAIAFSLACSYIYINNDIHDLEKDKMHPRKKDRPIASGKISIRSAYIYGILCLTISFICLLSLKSIEGGICIGIYILLNLLYSFGAKNLPIIDICILVSGFFLRVLFGALINNIVISSWLFLTIIMLSCYLAFGKRRNELKISQPQNTRSVLKEYNYDFLDKNMYMCQALVIMFYALWTMEYRGGVTNGFKYSNCFNYSV